MASSDSGQPSVTSVVGLTVLNGILIFFMQCGFLSLEVGFGRVKNVINILLKNASSIMLSALCWWATGFAFSHGDSNNGFIGSSLFFQPSDDASQRSWFFSWTFAVTTVTIVSGCLAERTTLSTYPLVTVLLSAWVHPVVAHWVWDSGGWLRNVASCRFLDYAGGTVVHCVGGLTGLIGAKMVGPRIGRFDDAAGIKAILGHDAARMCLGTFMLWFGWFGFNCGTVFTYNTTAGFALDRIAMNMTITGSTAGLLTLFVSSARTGRIDLVLCCNGLLTGLVAATGCCGFIDPWAAFVVGTLAAVVYLSLSTALLWLRVDDPMESSILHCGGGLLGVLMNGAFARPRYVALLGPGQALDAWDCGGFFLDSHNGGLQLGMQLLGCAVICAWTLAFTVPLFWLLSYAERLRVDQATELAGMDTMEHGGPAYPEFNMMPAHPPGDRA